MYVQYVYILYKSWYGKALTIFLIQKMLFWLKTYHHLPAFVLIVYIYIYIYIYTVAFVSLPTNQVIKFLYHTNCMQTGETAQSLGAVLLDRGVV